mmetsp:Transcript_32697/g.45377  ORF Transcript_32697/g.45377 Transcript_32697/m.45377 type:complete len:291 (-) Transcript_32697:183-1055(-)|eukprot:CAMPEP_0196589128 /NCGR_PEP_ID=MMETSP1081-20130531/62757_1 /TAXON_ID=36882 /ORGANISM="Pyramimonas amylifera, Strain CCMP720" /LENGTH=290 /DNA_ID=CAMNT_0041911845 /DNA_START=349 /DNA_END=1221 /DNA_ORIENTATION=+
MDHAFAGAFAGIIGTVLGFPLDTIKTRMQATSSTNLGPANLAFKIIRNEGIIRGFYRGIGPPIVALTTLNTLGFSCYAYCKNVLGVGRVGPVAMNNGDIKFEFDPKVLVAGSMCGPIGSLISTPFEFVKIQMQLDNVSGNRYSSSWNAVGCIYREHGMRALYTGHAVNTIREVIFLAAYFGFYEHSKAIFEQKLPLIVAVPVAGGLSGALGWMSCFPFDCIKANVQGQKLSANHNNRINGRAAALQILKSKGFFGLYSGASPSVLRAFLVSGSRFSAYEFALWLVQDKEE